MQALFLNPGFVTATIGFLAFGFLSIFGLRSPLKFVPVLLLQLCYKSIWFIGVILPLLISAQLPSYAIPIAIIFATLSSEI